jgi:cell wall-associated NlpC family hydrolase
LFLYAALKGKTVVGSVQALVKGQAPSTAPSGGQIPIATEIASAAAAAAGSVTLTPSGGSAPGGAPGGIAADAQRYVGHAYFFGGAPGRDGSHAWDCSSFCNWVVGHDAGRAIPGYAAGKYDGSVHGPATGEWLLWNGAVTVPAAQAQPGDLVVWYSHMGVYIGGGQMVSALNERLGTLQTSIAGGSPGGEGSGSYRRLR